MTLEELKVEYSKLQEENNNLKTQISDYKENYENVVKEKDTLSTEVTRLKNVNFDLFERVNTTYVKESKEVEENNVSRETLKEDNVKSLEDITKELI